MTNPKDILESDVEKECRAWVENEGGIWIKLLADGRKGIPDNEVMMPPIKVAGYEFPVTLKVELKRPVGGKISPHQEKWIRDIRNLEHPVYVCKSLDELKNAVEDTKRMVVKLIQLIILKRTGVVSSITVLLNDK